MPLIVEIKTTKGKVVRLNFPVEVWQAKGSYTFLYHSTDELESVTIDPDHVLPDVNTDNNSWHR